MTWQRLSLGSDISKNLKYIIPVIVLGAGIAMMIIGGIGSSNVATPAIEGKLAPGNDIIILDYSDISDYDAVGTGTPDDPMTISDYTNLDLIKINSWNWWMTYPNSTVGPIYLRFYNCNVTTSTTPVTEIYDSRHIIFEKCFLILYPQLEAYTRLNNSEYIWFTNTSFKYQLYYSSNPAYKIDNIFFTDCTGDGTYFPLYGGKYWGNVTNINWRKTLQVYSGAGQTELDAFVDVKFISCQFSSINIKMVRSQLINCNLGNYIVVFYSKNSSISNCSAGVVAMVSIQYSTAIVVDDCTIYALSMSNHHPSMIGTNVIKNSRVVSVDIYSYGFPVLPNALANVTVINNTINILSSTYSRLTLIANNSFVGYMPNPTNMVLNLNGIQVTCHITNNTFSNYNTQYIIFANNNFYPTIFSYNEVFNNRGGYCGLFYANGVIYSHNKIHHNVLDYGGGASLIYCFSSTGGWFYNEIYNNTAIRRTLGTQQYQSIVTVGMGSTFQNNKVFNNSAPTILALSGNNNQRIQITSNAFYSNTVWGFNLTAPGDLRKSILYVDYMLYYNVSHNYYSNYKAFYPSAISTNGEWWNTPYSKILNRAGANATDNFPLTSIPKPSVITPVSNAIVYPLHEVRATIVDDFTIVNTARFKIFNSTWSTASYYMVNSPSSPTTYIAAFDDSVLRPGIYTLGINVVDDQNNGIGFWWNYTIYYDLDVPIITINTPLAGWCILYTMLDIDAVIDAEVGLAEVYYTVHNSSWSIRHDFTISNVYHVVIAELWAFSILQDGTYYFTIHGRDSLGNYNNKSVLVYFDKFTPSTSFSPGNNTYMDVQTRFLFYTNENYTASNYQVNLIFDNRNPTMEDLTHHMLYNNTGNYWYFDYPNWITDGIFDIHGELAYYYGENLRKIHFEMSNYTIDTHDSYMVFWLPNPIVYSKSFSLAGYVSDELDIIDDSLHAVLNSSSGDFIVIDLDVNTRWDRALYFSKGITLPSNWHDGYTDISVHASNLFGRESILVYRVQFSTVASEINITTPLGFEWREYMDMSANITDSNGVKNVTANLIHEYMVVDQDIQMYQISGFNYSARLDRNDYMSLHDGSYQFQILVTDNTNSVSLSSTWNFIINFQNPVIDFLNPGVIYLGTYLIVSISDANLIDPLACNYTISNSTFSCDRDFDFYFGYETGTTIFYANPFLVPLLCDGVYDLAIYGMDSFGRTNVLLENVIVDFTGPTMTVLTPLEGEVLENPVIIVAVNASDVNGVDSVRVEIWPDIWTGEYYPFMLDDQGAGIYSKAFDMSSLDDGRYGIYYFCNDTFGAETFMYSSYNLNRFSPSLVWNSPLNNTVWNNTLRFNIACHDGNGLFNLSVRVYNATYEYLTESPNNGNDLTGEINLDITFLGESKYNFTFDIVDGYGKPAHCDGWFWVDRELPNVAIVVPTNNTVIITALFDITATISDSYGILTNKFRLYNATYSTAWVDLVKGVGFTYYKQYDSYALRDGVYTLEVRSTDTILNQHTSKTISIELKNRHVPSLYVLKPTGSLVSNLALINASIRVTDPYGDDEVKNVWFYIADALGWKTANMTMTKVGNIYYYMINASILANQNYYLRFYAIDNYGYAVTGIKGFTYNDVAPSISIQSPTQYQVIKQSLSVSAFVSDATGIRKVWYELRNYTGVAFSSPMMLSGGKYSATTNTSTFSDGEYDLLVFATDYNGKTTQSLLYVTIQNAVPLEYVSSPPNFSDITLSNATITLTIRSINGVFLDGGLISIRWLNGTVLVSYQAMTLSGDKLRLTYVFALLAVANNVEDILIVEFAFSDEYLANYAFTTHLNINFTRPSSPSPAPAGGKMIYDILLYGGIAVAGAGGAVMAFVFIKKRRIVRNVP